MALRDQPYLPLYVQDFLTDEKLAECSAESTGVYIRLMCLMHKSHTYGKILLRQKERQSEQPVLDFAEKLSRQMPYKSEVIARALDELIDEEVVYIEDNALCQKRMIRDAELSEKRSFAGRKGAENANKRFIKKEGFAAAKPPANSTAKASANTENEDEDEYVIETENDNALGKVMSFYMDKINPTPSSQIVDDLKAYVDDLDAGVVIHAMQIAINERKFGWSYINAILRRYHSDGLDTMEKVLQSEQAFQSKKPRGGENRKKTGTTFWDVAERMKEEEL